MKISAFLAAVGLVSVTVAIAGCKASPEEAAIVEAKEKVKRELVDPESALFRDIAVKRMKLGGLNVCGEVNSKNSLGGYAGYREFFVKNGVAVLKPDAGLAIGEIAQLDVIGAQYKFLAEHLNACLNGVETVGRE